MADFRRGACRAWVALAATALAGPGCDRPPAPPDDTFARLPAILEEAGIPGLSYAVIENGAIRDERGIGVACVDGPTPVGPGTLFEAASLTKPVFAYGVLMLVEQGLLDLDTPLTTYLDFPDVEGDPRVHDITARIVLSHTTGLPNWRREGPLTLGPDPGSAFGYSGEGFVFLQRVVARITGEPVDEFLTREVLVPLGMDASRLVWSDDLEAVTATGHDEFGDPVEKWKPTEMNAASSLHTTAGDYARFVIEITRPTLLRRETVVRMLTPESDAADGVFWGLGWGLEDAEIGGGEQRLFWHWGSNGVFRCFVVAEADRGRGLVYFSNSQNGHAVADCLTEAVFPGRHPALAWRDFTAFDSPDFRIDRALTRAGRDGGAEAVRVEYERLRTAHAEEDFSESLLNRVGYRLLGQGDAEAAVLVFREAVAAHPDSWNAYDSLGEGLAAGGDTLAAIRNYEESLARNPDNANAVMMLARLRGEVPAADPPAASAP